MSTCRINKFFFSLVMLVMVCSLNACSYRLTKERQDAITQKDHGFLHVYFRKAEFGKYLYIRWYTKLYINDEKYADYRFKPGETYAVPVPVGNILITYKITDYSPSYLKITHTSGYSFWRIQAQKTLSIEVKKNQHIYLKIVNIGKQYTGLGCVGSQGVTVIPLPLQYQDVALVVDRIEEGDNSKIRK